MPSVVTPEAMRRIDAAAAEATEVLVERAGAAVARAAVRLLGGRYDRRVAVICGKGNNGADGRVAARRLRRDGIGVSIIEADRLPARIDGVDLVIDAAYGTGFRGEFCAPDVTAPVMAVDIPSGIDGLTGVASGRPLAAALTVTFAAWKPGLLFADGPRHAGRVEVAEIGLPTPSDCWLVTDGDVGGWLPESRRDDHKWRHAVWVVAGSPGMGGAAVLASRGAARGGAGYVRLGIPGLDEPRAPAEVVQQPLSADGWASAVIDGAGRFGAVVAGPGLGRSTAARDSMLALASDCPVPLVVDGDGLWCLANTDRPLPGDRPTVLTPHDGEFALLAGATPGADRIAAARRLADDRHAIVLLKGPTTVIAAPDGQVRLVHSGDERLATAGTGDVLAGLTGALLARGLDPFDAAAAAAHLHGRAATLSPQRVGFVAGDLPELLPVAWQHCIEAAS